jgi:hypothetical protein
MFMLRLDYRPILGYRASANNLTTELGISTFKFTPRWRKVAAIMPHQTI